ncbi:MAG: LPXTG cell wall anchor domain-containing protein, partial [Alkaliphilus sp.]|nr:LPXTG cell wall anchor domain-containing protein [Alkaliphilus sp.]
EIEDEEIPLGAMEELIMDEPIPLGSALPQTGEIDPRAYYGLGSIISMVGLAMKKWRRFNPFR